MARLDPMLRVLSRPGSDIRLVAGQVPRVTVGDTSEPIHGQRFNAPQIRFLVEEIAPENSKRTLESTGEVEFTYAVPNFGPVTVSVSRWNGDIEVIFRRVGARDEASVLPKGGFEIELEPDVIGASTYETTNGSTRTPISEIRGDDSELSLHDLLRELVSNKGVDLHIFTGEPPRLRRDGEWFRTHHAAMTASFVEDLLNPIIPPARRAAFDADRSVLFTYDLARVSRFRVRVFTDRAGMGAAFRVIPNEVPLAEKLLPPAVQNVIFLDRGLVLLAGVSESGKTTTLSSLVDLINRKRTGLVVAVEELIEFSHSSKMAIVSQREVGSHTKSFSSAVREALIENPDVLVIDELRDAETISLALQAALSRRLVIAGICAPNATLAIERVIYADGDRNQQLRLMLGDCLALALGQTLCKRVGGGHVLAMEMLSDHPSILGLIREGKPRQIAPTLQGQRKAKVVLELDALLELVKSGVVDPREALAKTSDRAGFALAARAAGIETGAFAGEER